MKKNTMSGILMFVLVASMLSVPVHADTNYFQTFFGNIITSFQNLIGNIPSFSQSLYQSGNLAVINCNGACPANQASGPATDGQTLYCYFTSGQPPGTQVTWTKNGVVWGSGVPGILANPLISAGDTWICSGAGSSVTVVVQAAPTIPSTPTGFTASQDNEDDPICSSSDFCTVKMSMNAVSGATQYRYYISNSQSGTYSIFDDTNDLVVIAGDPRFMSGTTWYFKATAYNSAGESLSTNVIPVTFTQYPPTTSSAQTTNQSTSTGTSPSTPTGLMASAISSSQINLQWSPVSGATSYILFKSLKSDMSNFVQVSGIAGTTYSSTGLNPGTTYYYNVYATNSYGNSGPSSVVSSTTQAAVCSPNWQCTTWSACLASNTQTRTCTDANNCGVTTGQPTQSQQCLYVSPTCDSSHTEGDVIIKSCDTTARINQTTWHCSGSTWVQQVSLSQTCASGTQCIGVNNQCTQISSGQQFASNVAVNTVPSPITNQVNTPSAPAVVAPPTQDNTTTYLEAGIGIAVIVLVVVLLSKKKRRR